MKTYKRKTPEPNRQSSRLIKSVLALAGVSQTQIAQDLNVKLPAVNAVVCGRRRTKRILNHISEITGKSVSDLWPEPNHLEEASNEKSRVI